MKRRESAKRCDFSAVLGEELQGFHVDLEGYVILDDTGRKLVIFTCTYTFPHWYFHSQHC
jgi:hypothetical protein